MFYKISWSIDEMFVLISNSSIKGKIMDMVQAKEVDEMAKDLKKMNRAELLEILVEITKENEKLHSEIKKLQTKLSEREIVIQNAGSIADAALQLNNVFKSAEYAAKDYVDNVVRMYNEQEKACEVMEREMKRKCATLLAETEKKCQEREAKTEQQYSELVLQLKSFYKQ